MNKVVLVGRLTKDPEIRAFTNGNSVANFTVAVNRTFKNREGVVEADFIPVQVTGPQVNVVQKYVTKGSQIGIDGRIQIRSYDAQDGSKRYVTEIVVENAEFVGGRNEGSAPSANTDTTYMDAPSEAPVDAMPEYDISKSDPYENYDKDVSLSDDDLPFL